MSEHPAILHLRLLASHPGYWEVRALARRPGETRMEPRGSFFLIATRTPTGDLIYDRLDGAVAWADAQDRAGAELFVGMNPREREGRTKDAVGRVTACFVDLDLPEGESQESILAAVLEGAEPLPSLVVNSGYGLHVVYLLREAATDKATWRRVQRAFARRFAEWGADPKVAGDESRILRLVPYPNRKKAAAGVPTAILYESDYRYDLGELATALAPQPEAHGPGEGAAFTIPAMRLEEPTATPAEEVDAETMQRLAERHETTRGVFEAWIKRALKLGLHYGSIPAPDGQPASKPTLLKPGAEAIGTLFGWRFYFIADLETLQMYGAAGAGVFAYVCHVVNAAGQTVGQGRGLAELREPGMMNGNKAVKLAMKRAQVDAVLRCAGLSQFFTQDLDDPVYIAPEAAATGQPAPATPAAPALVTPDRLRALRRWLERAGQDEATVLQYYRIRTLDELRAGQAEVLIRRCQEIEGAAGRPLRSWTPRKATP